MRRESYDETYSDKLHGSTTLIYMALQQSHRCHNGSPPEADRVYHNGGRLKVWKHIGPKERKWA